MAKDTFIFYKDWFDVIDGMPDEDRLAAYDAVVRYAFAGEVCRDKYIGAVTALMTKTIDRNSQRYEQTSEKRRQAGLKGMQKRWGTKKEDEETCEKTDTFITNVTKITDNDNVNDNENVNENDNVNDKSAEADLRDTEKKSIKKDTEKGQAHAVPVPDKKPSPKVFVPPTLEQVEEYCTERFEKNGIQIPAVEFFEFYTMKGWMVGKNKMKDWKAAVRTWEQKRIQDGYYSQQQKTTTNHVQATTDNRISSRRDAERAKRDQETIQLLNQLAAANKYSPGEDELDAYEEEVLLGSYD